MKIVFIQPNVGFKGHTWEALGIGYIASCLKKAYSDIEIEFYSAFFDPDEKITNACKDASIIGITCTSPQYKHGLQLSKKIKNKNNIIVFGGVHPSALPELLLKEESIDIVVKGEGELSMVQVVSDLKNGIDKSKTIYSSPYIQDLDTIPFPDRKTIKNERNIQQAYKDNNLRITSILSSRGCPQRCSFCCSNVVWQRKVRFRSPGNILDEVEELVKEWNIQFFKFSDDTFTSNRKRVIDFCKLKIERGLETPFGANSHVNTIDKEVLEYLSKSNCQELWYGVESGSPEILKDIHKNADVEKIKKVFKLTRDYGIKTRAYFLLGTPNETLADIKKTEKLCDEIQPDIVGFTLLAPYPTNEYFKYDEMKDWDWSIFDEYNNDWVHTKTLTNQDLKDEQKRLVEKYKKGITYRQKGDTD